VLAYRLTRAAHADLAGEGARLWGGRWNSPGTPMVYLSSSAALALLEVRVHLDVPFDSLPLDYVQLTIDLDGLSIETVDPIPGDAAACAAFGDAWLRERRSAVLQVPSVIIPENSNLLLNPAHHETARAHEVARRNFEFDERLWGGA
jgi:RES domain-containing protein